MRLSKIAAILTATTVLSLGASLPATAQDGMYSVKLNRTEIVHLPEPAAAIVIGNPNVADVTVHSSDTIFIVGRGYGDTNIIILNSEGQKVMDAEVHVTTSNSNKNVRIFSGSSTMRASYNCSPYCQPAPLLGDNPEFVDANSPQAQQSNNSIAGGTTSAPPGVLGMATENEMSVDEQDMELNSPPSDY